MYDQFRLNEPWDSAHNKPLVEKMPKVFAAGDETLQSSGKTIFLAPTGGGMVFGGRVPVRLRDIRDGTSNTMMVLTVKPKFAVEWTKPEDWEFDENKPFEQLTGTNGMGFQFVCCDGAAHRSDKPMTVDVLKALLTIDGREIVEF